MSGILKGKPLSDTWCNSSLGILQIFYSNPPITMKSSTIDDCSEAQDHTLMAYNFTTVNSKANVIEANESSIEKFSRELFTCFSHVNQNKSKLEVRQQNERNYWKEENSHVKRN